MRGTVCLEVCVQKDADDCVIAAITMLTGHPYQRVRHVAGHEGPFTLHDQRRTVTALGNRLVRRTTFDVDHDTGLLWIKTRRRTRLHVVALFHGLLIDPADGLVWKSEAFFLQFPQKSPSVLYELQ